ncbi:MAG: peptidogalycan biosysnthesis protein, partial [Pseudomonadota bacterium]
MSNTYQIRIVNSLGDVDARVWNALRDGVPYNPFTSHEFLFALEKSGSATADTGWLGQHLVLETEQGEVLGAVPCYLKNHSQGEYVFDHGWADAFERAGGNYYPKLQCSVPFTPATGQRFLVPDCDNRDARIAALMQGLKQLCDRLQVSSAHVTFLLEDEWHFAGKQDYLLRTDQQFHWLNDNYSSFDGFLDALSSRKRK